MRERKGNGTREKSARIRGDRAPSWRRAPGRAIRKVSCAIRRTQTPRLTRLLTVERVRGSRARLRRVTARGRDPTAPSRSFRSPRVLATSRCARVPAKKPCAPEFCYLDTSVRLSSALERQRKKHCTKANNVRPISLYAGRLGVCVCPAPVIGRPPHRRRT